MQLEYDLLYESYDHEGYCSEEECIYEVEQINKQVILTNNYKTCLWYYFVILKKHLPMDVISIIINLRLELINYTFDKINYKDKDVTVNFDCHDNIYEKFFFGMYFTKNKNKLKTILNRKPRGYEYPSYYFQSIRPSNVIHTHEHRITIKKIRLKYL
jgi:hypothetical protein